MAPPKNHTRDDTFDTSDDAREGAMLDVLNGSAQSQLKTIVNRIENVNREIEEVQEARKEIYSEAKGNGFDVKIIRKVIARRKQDAAKRREEEDLIDTYELALGDL